SSSALSSAFSWQTRQICFVVLPPVEETQTRVEFHALSFVRLTVVTVFAIRMPTANSYKTQDVRSEFRDSVAMIEPAEARIYEYGTSRRMGRLRNRSGSRASHERTGGRTLYHGAARRSRSRRAVIRAIRGSRSTPTHSRPRDAATRPTVPEPAKGSRTRPRFWLTSSTVRTTGSGIESQMLSGWERGSGNIQHSVVPRRPPT